MLQIWWDFFGIQICFSLVKYVLDLQCCLHAGENLQGRFSCISWFTSFLYYIIKAWRSIVAYCVARSFVLLLHYIITDVFGIFLGGGGRGGGVTPENSWWGCAEHFFKSWPRFRTKNVIVLHPFSDLASKKLCHNYLDKNANKIDFLNCEFAYFSFFLIHLELKR